MPQKAKRTAMAMIRRLSVRRLSGSMKLENSALKKVWEPDGSIVDFTILKDGILAVGLFGQKLEELYLLKGGRSTRITAFNEDCLKDRYVAVPQKCTVAKKPFAIEGWVLAPYGYDPKRKYPAILDIHGGPRCAYGTVFMTPMSGRWRMSSPVIRNRSFRRMRRRRSASPTAPSCWASATASWRKTKSRTRR